MKYNLYYTDRSGEESLLKSDLSQDGLDHILAAFELSENDNLQGLRVEKLFIDAQAS